VKILLDHCVPKPFKQELLEHQVSTARELGWEALKNGALLNEAQANGFEVFITVDQNIRYQQNLRNRSVVVRADGITIEDLRPLVPAVEELLTMVQRGKLYEIASLAGGHWSVRES
jgi:hypothetical protein